MNDEKWENILSNIEEKFGIEEKKSIEDDLTDDMGHSFKGTKDIVIFKGVLGRMKLERVNHPMIEDKKMHYHKGSGGTAQIEYSVSENEMTHRLKAYTWNDLMNDWEEMKLTGGEMKF